MEKSAFDELERELGKGIEKRISVPYRFGIIAGFLGRRVWDIMKYAGKILNLSGQFISQEAKEAIGTELGIERLALHAAALTLDIAKGDRQTFEAPLPVDMKKALDKLRLS